MLTTTPTPRKMLTTPLEILTCARTCPCPFPNPARRGRRNLVPRTAPQKYPLLDLPQQSGMLPTVPHSAPAVPHTVHGWQWGAIETLHGEAVNARAP